MKVILIDDEYLALNQLKNQLSSISYVEVIGVFDNHLKGKDAILREDVDVVFLDIHLHGINGIELAEQILEFKPNIDIVFVTAFDQYAIKAFEINALDYILKPSSIKRIENTLERILSRTNEKVETETNSTQLIQVNLFGELFIGNQEFEYTPIHWRTSKAQELFLYLVQYRENLVRKYVLIDLLWPDFDIEKAQSQLYTTVYHVRKTLEPLEKYFRIIKVSEGYILKTSEVEIDIVNWENNMKSHLPINETTIDIWENYVTQYNGDYLQSYDYWWIEGERIRLKQMWLSKSFSLAQWHQAKHNLSKAKEIYEQIISLSPLTEEAYFELMKIYASLNDPLSVHKYFNILKSTLIKEVNVEPSEEIVQWYNRWERKQK